jgi:N-acylneuraminate cytidylyltransferase
MGEGKEEILAIIPARSGSKRIPNKNIRDFSGKPMLSYSIGTAKESGLFDEIMVSTDSSEIADLARRYQASVPFMRSRDNSDDHATLSEVTLEVLNNYESIGRRFTSFCLILPTSPLLTASRLNEGYRLLIQNNFKTVIPVCEFSYPVKRSLKIENNRLSMNWPEYENTRSQDLSPAYHDAGQFYWCITQSFLEEKRFFGPDCGAVILSTMEVQDIDTPDDWKLAELKYKLREKE